jgi:hypothetical protein
VLSHFHHHKHGKGARKHELGQRPGARSADVNPAAEMHEWIMALRLEAFHRLCRLPSLTIP